MRNRRGLMGSRKFGLALCTVLAGCVGTVPSPTEDLLECFGQRREVARSLLAGESSSLAGWRVGLVDIRRQHVSSYSSSVVGNAVHKCEELGIAEGGGIQLECNDELAESEGKGPLRCDEWRPGELRRCVVARYDLIPGMYYRFWVILTAELNQ